MAGSKVACHARWRQQQQGARQQVEVGDGYMWRQCESERQLVLKLYLYVIIESVVYLSNIFNDATIEARIVIRQV